MPNFDFLYFFENNQLIILELKRNDLPSEAVKSDIYKWLLIDKDTKVITLLDFISMKSCEHQQERFFRQGYLSFDSQQAIFIRESSSLQMILRPNHVDFLQESTLTAIRKQFSI